jgi:hypothetical protein
MIEYLIAGGITGAAAHLMEKDPVIGAGIGLALFWAGSPAQADLPEPIRVPATWYHDQVSRLAGGTPQVSTAPPGQRRGDYVTGSGTPEDPIVVNFDRDTYSTWGTS